MAGPCRTCGGARKFGAVREATPVGSPSPQQQQQITAGKTVHVATPAVRKS